MYQVSYPADLEVRRRALATVDFVPYGYRRTRAEDPSTLPPRKAITSLRQVRVRACVSVEWHWPRVRPNLGI
jgi:hypothetical protein